MAEEIRYVKTEFGVMRDTGLLICKCRRVLAPNILVTKEDGTKVCPNCGVEQSKMSRFLDREGVPPEVEEYFYKSE